MMQGDGPVSWVTAVHYDFFTPQAGCEVHGASKTN